MKGKNHDEHPPHDKLDEFASQDLRKDEMPEDEKNRILKHLSFCEQCYNYVVSVLQVKKNTNKKTFEEIIADKPRKKLSREQTVDFILQQIKKDQKKNRD